MDIGLDEPAWEIIEGFVKIFNRRLKLSTFVVRIAPLVVDERVFWINFSRLGQVPDAPHILPKLDVDHAPLDQKVLVFRLSLQSELGVNQSFLWPSRLEISATHSIQDGGAARTKLKSFKEVAYRWFDVPKLRLASP